MKVKCVANTGAALSEKQILKGNTRESAYEWLKVGKIYNVYGILLIQDTLNYLVVGEYPNAIYFEPVELFKLIDNKIPPDWYFKPSIELVPAEKLIDPFSATWGYKELAIDIRHSDRLLEREPEDIKIFLKRKHEIDEWENKQHKE